MKVWDCHYHVVWCTKYRRKVITSTNPTLDAPVVDGDPGPVDEALKKIISSVCEKVGATVESLEVMPDHIHLLVSVDPVYGVSRLVGTIKGRSSRVLREQFPSLRRRLPTLWTRSSFIATTGSDPLDKIHEYIESQRGV